MECLVILCITGLCLCHVVYAQAVIQCAYTLDGWNKASVSLQYQKPKYYHCLTDEFGHFNQKCSQRILVPKGISEFTIQLNIKKIPCQSKQKFAFFMRTTQTNNLLSNETRRQSDENGMQWV